MTLEVEPKHWPIDATRAACAIIAANELHAGSLIYIEKVLAAVWARNLDISEESVLRMLARECNYDPDELISLADSPATADRYQAFTREAIEKGIVGSPTCVFEGQLFFGQDRLDFLQEAITARIDNVQQDTQFRRS